MTFYEAIRARFQEKLCPTGTDPVSAEFPFADLYMAAPPSDCAMPYAVLDTGNEPHTGYGFGVEFHSEDFTISVVDRNQEDADALARMVIDAFNDCESELSIDGMSVSLLRKDRASSKLVESDFWIAEIAYTTEYETMRNRT